MVTNGNITATKVASGLTLADNSVKFGLVTVCDNGGIVLREYRITAQEVVDINAARQRIPTGCTNAEWENGLSFLGGWVIDEGQALVRADGSMIAYVASKPANNKINPQLMRLAPEEFAVSIINNIDVLPTTKTQLDVIRGYVLPGTP